MVSEGKLGGECIGVEMGYLGWGWRYGELDGWYGELLGDA